MEILFKKYISNLQTLDSVCNKARCTISAETVILEMQRPLFACRAEVVGSRLHPRDGRGCLRDFTRLCFLRKEISLSMLMQSVHQVVNSCVSLMCSFAKCLRVFWRKGVEDKVLISAILSVWGNGWMEDVRAASGEAVGQPREHAAPLPPPGSCSSLGWPISTASGGWQLLKISMLAGPGALCWEDPLYPWAGLQWAPLGRAFGWAALEGVTQERSTNNPWSMEGTTGSLLRSQLLLHSSFCCSWKVCHCNLETVHD